MIRLTIIVDVPDDVDVDKVKADMEEAAAKLEAELIETFEEEID